MLSQGRSRSFRRGKGRFPSPVRALSLSRRSLAPHPSRNRGFRNAFLMRLRRGRLCQGSADARPRHRLPGVWAGSDHLRRPHCALGLPPTFPRGSLPLRCGPRRSSRRSSGPFSRFTQRASTSCHAACDLRPADACWTCSASVGTPGRLRVGQVGWNLLAGARPRSVGAVPGNERERCSLAARRCAPVQR